MQLVTGGAGFIGSHLVTRLVELGKRVRVLDDLSTGRMENLAPVLSEIELIAGDLRDEESIRRAVQGAEVVHHLGAVPSVPRSIADPKRTFDTNVGGTLNLLIGARDAGCRRVVFASSSSVYGDTPTLPKDEHMMPTPMSPYAVSKLAGEHLCRVFHGVYGLETVALRYFNVFGPRQDPSSQYAAVIPKFLDALRSDRRPIIYGNGEQSRDFTYVSNVVEANVLAAGAADAPGHVFNIASGSPVTVNRMLGLLVEMTGLATVPEFAPARPGEVAHSWADTSAARKILGYQVTVPFEQGLAQTVAATLANGR